MFQEQPHHGLLWHKKAQGAQVFDFERGLHQNRHLLKGSLVYVKEGFSF